jgi:DWNN domain
MSATILYKFRSGTTFEALPLPGSAARLLDIKKGIVLAKKLDQGSMDFDLSVKDASSGIDYVDDTLILPRGTRLIVQRLPAARGQGILAKIARSQMGGGPATATSAAAAASNVPADFYTIDGRGNEDEEFVSSNLAQQSEERELAALRAATESGAAANSGGLGRGSGGAAGGGPRLAGGGGFRPNPTAGSGPPPPPPRGVGGAALLQQQQSRYQTNRPNADPDLREQDFQPKKRATGIPRTFLSLSAPTATDGGEGGGGGGPILQPNTIGFEELLNRGGGQSENAAGTKRDLDYAIKLTATTVPEYLQCAICHGVVRDAMMLPWDPEGRTTCEQCIRNALTESGFRCPLTHQEGVSPDDLLPNHALRKAAVQFVNDVMEKVKEIDRQADVEEIIEPESGSKSNLLQGDLHDKGVVLTRRASAAEKRLKEEEDPFGGGDDDFGGDVFAVEPDKPVEVTDPDVVASEKANAPQTKASVKIEEGTKAASAGSNSAPKIKEESPAVKTEDMPSAAKPVAPTAMATNIKTEPVSEPQSTVANQTQQSSRREPNRRRGPPVGYTMGPAGGAAITPTISAPPPPPPPPAIKADPDRTTDAEDRDRSSRSRSSTAAGPPSHDGNGVEGGGDRGYSGRYDAHDPPRGGRGRGGPPPPYHDRHHRTDVSTTTQIAHGFCCCECKCMYVCRLDVCSYSFFCRSDAFSGQGLVSKHTWTCVAFGWPDDLRATEIDWRRRIKLR